MFCSEIGSNRWSCENWNQSQSGDSFLPVYSHQLLLTASNSLAVSNSVSSKQHKAGVSQMWRPCVQVFESSHWTQSVESSYWTKSFPGQLQLGSGTQEMGSWLRSTCNCGGAGASGGGGGHFAIFCNLYNIWCAGWQTLEVLCWHECELMR